MVFRRNKLLTLILLIGVVGALWILLGRYRVEMSNRAVEIAVDYPEVAQLAGIADLSISDTLSKLKDVGVTSVAVQEQTVADLITLGMIDVVDTPGRGMMLTRVPPSTVAALEASGLDVRHLSTSTDGTMSVRIESEPEFVLVQPVGLSEEALEDAKAANVRVVARMVNRPECRDETIVKTFSQLKQNGITTVIFAADQVMGFRGGIEDVAKALKKEGLIYGSIEFAKQKGDSGLSRKMEPDIVRVHSITAAEMGITDRPTAIERFAKAAKERNIRLAYVRMYDFGDKNPLKTNLDYIAGITARLRAEGMGIGQARPFPQVPAPRVALLLIALGTAAGLMLLLVSIIKLRPAIVLAGFLFTALILCGLVMSGLPLGIKLTALIAAITFPTLAVLFAASGTPDEPKDARPRAFTLPALTRFIGAVFISIVGGLIVAALLSRTEFMIRIDQFAGVKLAHLLPILLISFLLAAGIGWGPDGWKEQKERVVNNLNRLGKEPFLFWQVGIAMVLLVMFAMVMMRSGNDSGVAVSGLELKLRSVLDKILIVRPRTKEFLIGHPAMFLGIAAALGGRRGWAALLLVIGTIGEVGMVNTFCHIHTPIELSVLRSAIGAILGVLIGLVVLLIFSGRANRARSGECSQEAMSAAKRVQK